MNFIKSMGPTSEHTPPPLTHFRSPSTRAPRRTPPRRRHSSSSPQGHPSRPAAACPRTRLMLFSLAISFITSATIPSPRTKLPSATATHCSTRSVGDCTLRSEMSTSMRTGPVHSSPLSARRASRAESPPSLVLVLAARRSAAWRLWTCLYSSALTFFGALDADVPLGVLLGRLDGLDVEVLVVGD